MQAPTEAQFQLAAKLGIDLSGTSASEAAARLRVEVIQAITEPGRLYPTSPEQEELASSLGIEGLAKYSTVAAAQIGAELQSLNDRALAKHGFRPGMIVKYKGSPHARHSSFLVGERYVISSISPTGRIYIKGAGGKFTYASQIEPEVP